MPPIRQPITVAIRALFVAIFVVTFPASAADGPVDLEWDDLIPDDILKQFDDLASGMGVREHGDMSPYEDPVLLNTVTDEYNGKTVRLPGFIVPIEYTGVGVTSLLLVPYVGACIHVPPPPPNQLVYVTTDKPYEFNGLFEAVWVTGTMSTTPATTEIAEAGYTISEGKLEAYEW